MQVSRRDFLKAAAAAGAVASLPLAARAADASALRTQLYKALIAPVADDATCERIAKAGFPGVELNKKDVTVEQARQGRLTAEKHGVKIHSFMGGWADFNHADPAARRASIDDVKRMIQVTAAYGATTILLVPCRVGGGGLAIPKPSQFKIDFDPGTLRAKAVVEGDNAPFAAYIEAQNRATEQIGRAHV